MDFLNIGSGEILFIVLLAILLVGPKRAVEFLQQGSRLIGRLRKEWYSVQREVMAEVNAIQKETLGSTAQEIQALGQELQSEVRALQETIQDPLQPPPADPTP